MKKIVDGLKNTDQSEMVDNIIKFCRNIVENSDIEMNDMIFGGTEEEIIQRGTDWCTDISRAACVMFQIAGLPSRIINTANTRYAYCGHVVTEVYYKNEWGIADPINGTVIKDQNGNTVSAWEIYNSCYDEQYKSVGISNYYIDEKEQYIYDTSGLNDYYREILLHSAEQWAGGCRWIHGEDLF